jgi:hypothetical protein
MENNQTVPDIEKKTSHKYEPSKAFIDICHFL